MTRSLERGRVENRARAALALPVLVVDDEAIERIEAISANGSLAALPADRLECSESVVRKRVSRGLARLRKRIEEENTR